MKVDLFGQELLGSGYYRQQTAAEGLLFRLELNLQAKAGREPNSLLKVCDGRYLWTWRRLGGEESLERIDIVRVVRLLEEAGEIKLLEKQGGMSAFGGLPRLLRQLGATFWFDQFDEVRLNDQMAAWRIGGRWRDGSPADGSADAADEPPENRSSRPRDLSGHLPGAVVLFFGQEDLFPHRIEFRRPTTEAGQGGEPIVAVELFEVNLNVPINPTRFVYKPGDLDAADRTDDFLKNLGLE
jgi:hypothetical protein